MGYLGSAGEGVLALAAIIACTAGFASLGDWQGYYTSFAAGSTDAWVRGGGRIASMGLGLPVGFSETLLSVMAILFAATTMDAGVRLQRYIIQEWGNIYKLDFLTGRYLATFIAVIFCVALAFGAGEGGGTGGLIIWPLFGTTNQLLAALTLLVLSVLFMKLGRPVIFTLVPLTFLLVMTVIALIIQLRTFYDQGNLLLVATDLLILGATIWVALEALSALIKAKRGRGQREVFSGPRGRE